MLTPWARLLGDSTTKYESGCRITVITPPLMPHGPSGAELQRPWVRGPSALHRCCAASALNTSIHRPARRSAARTLFCIGHHPSRCTTRRIDTTGAPDSLVRAALLCWHPAQHEGRRARGRLGWRAGFPLLARRLRHVVAGVLVCGAPPVAAVEARRSHRLQTPSRTPSVASQVGVRPHAS